MTELRGVCVISLTPFDTDGAVDLPSLANLLEFYIKAGVHGVTLLGIMGEANRLTEAERDQVVQATMETVAGRVPVIVGCSAAGTHQAVTYVKRAAAAGVDAVMVAPPNQIRQLDLVVDHFERVGAASDLPLVVQDEPVTTGVVLPPSFFEQVVTRVPTACAVKVEESPTLPKISRIREVTGDRLTLFGGLGGMYFFEELERGAAGIMTGFAYPDLLVAIYEAHQKGDKAAARSLFYQYLPLIRYEAQLGVTGVAIRKLAYKARGAIASAYVRPPAPTVDRRTLRELVDIAQHLGLTDLEEARL
ncbi:MAG: dihydrodipicolinate synthase family protein [Alicyclobacillus mali]|uniref:dihydrodipicolinate synthase family protein n=1 Tax=Alicyclobacillus mali (ex Roth et al. 2021) TaxID=1123961 RepID=UPI0023F3A9AE|nr:dihydrodipicolinate synthase family protein [Alicyclobacillus mali (ex Roth et al. 2021)]MCL6487369.1 dihydrodipicolinate synthase family protein [Alicyclobacillus mali (ex Roth et al. 2021)]